MKILFFTSGLGLGNSTRCHAVIERLHTAGARVEVVTSGNGLWYFSDKPEVSDIHEVKSLAYGSKDGAISIARTFSSVGEMLSIFRSNARLLGSLLDRISPDVVVTDSDYNFVPIKRRNIPMAALNNADVVWHSYFNFENRPSSIRPQFYGVEMLDYWFHKIVPDLVVSPSLDPDIKQDGGNIVRVGPIVREGYEATVRNGPAQRAVVMLSGSVFGTPVNFDRTQYPVAIDVIGREAPEGWSGGPDVTFHGKITDTYPLLKQADVVVVNGGFSAVSEMFWMKKPLVVVPVPNHAEQWVNAKTIEHLRVGMIATQSNYQDVMLEAIARLDGFRAAYEALPQAQDGAKQAAVAIARLAKQRRP